jgi:uridine kinase
MDILVIGIAGGTGSGKTTLTNRLKERFGKDISVISHDNYYRSQDDISFEERVKTNYDHPDSFETDLLIEHLKQLKNGHSIECPVYSFSEHTRTKDTRKIDPTKVIIVEGILIFQNPELLNMLDIRIFVDTDPDVRILRRILRDVKERGRSLDSVVTQYLATVKPMHEQFVEPSKRNADIIVLEGGYNLVALDMIIQRIQGHVEVTDE